jgi:predicted lipase
LIPTQIPLVLWEQISQIVTVPTVELTLLVVVSYRGTVPTSLKNWIEDLNFAETTPYPKAPNALVHSGFYNAYLTVQNQTLQSVSELRRFKYLNLYSTISSQHPDFTIMVTGHSLGAAIAEIAALDIKLELGEDVAVYNYGDPRVGNEGFATFYNQKITTNFRVVNQSKKILVI